MNLISCCHICKEQCFHHRGEEQYTIMPFYKRHRKCMRRDRFSVQTLDDQYQEENWMRERDGYTKWRPRIEFVCPIHGKQDLEHFGLSRLVLKCGCSANYANCAPDEITFMAFDEMGVKK